jgi:nucleoside-diphosphate-sugar epimerase
MRILITGGAGFLGLHLARRFHQENHLITSLDIADVHTEEYPNTTIFVKGDVRDVRLVDSIMKDVDVIIHAAAALPLWNKQDIMDINVNGTSSILRSALKNNIKRVVFISSTAVYGVPKKHPIYETDPVYGVGPYGQSKIDAEKLCRDYRKKGLHITTIRPKTFIGTHRLGVFEILFDWIKDGKRIPLIGKGDNRYQLLDVDDLVEAIYLFTTKKYISLFNGEFNIGALSFGQIKDDLEAMFKEVHSSSHVFPLPAWPIKKALWIFEKLKLSPLYQWVYDTADKDSFVSIDKLMKVLNWKPTFSNTQALVKAYTWYKEHYTEIKKGESGITHTVGWNQGILGWFKKVM